jgi:hypothetical protein
MGSEAWSEMRDRGTGSLSRFRSGAGRGDRTPDPVGVVYFYKKEGE